MRISARNPILRRELTRLWRFRPRWLWLRKLIVAFGLAAIIGGIAATFRDLSAPSRELAINAVWIINIAVALRALWAGASAASREFTGSTFDSLVLTGVGARRMLIGSWLGALRIAAPWGVALGTIRLAMLPISMLGVTTRFSVELVARYGPPTPIDPFPYPEWMTFYDWVPWAAVLAVISAVLLSVLEVMAGTAIGVAAGILTRHSTSAVLLAGMIRLLPLLLGGTVALRDGTVDFTNPYSIFIHTGTALADMGTSPLSRLTVPYMAWARTTHANAILGLGAAYAAILVLLVVALLTAYLGLRRRGARHISRRRERPHAFRLPAAFRASGDARL